MNQTTSFNYFIFIPKFNHHYDLLGDHIFGLCMPMGLVPLASLANQNGFPSRLVHLGIERISGRENNFFERIYKEQPKICALSLHWHFQSYDVIQTARKIRQISPETFIVLGGFTASFFHEEIITHYPEINGIIRGDSEKGIIQLFKSVIHNDGELSTVSNLTFRQNGRLRINPLNFVAQEEDLARLDYTDFSVMDHHEEYMNTVSGTWLWVPKLGKFGNKIILSGHNFFPLSISRGCNECCSYCGGSAMSQRQINNRNNLTIRPLDSILNTLTALGNYDYQTVYMEFIPFNGQFKFYKNIFAKIASKPDRHIYLECRSMPPIDIMKAFSKNFGGDKKSYIALSPECRSERLRKMNKSGFYSNKQLKNFLRFCEINKCNMVLFGSVWLPGMTAGIIKENYKWYNSLKRNYRHLNRIIVERIQLDPACPMFMEPEKYNLITNLKSFTDFYHFHKRSSVIKCDMELGYRDNHFLTDEQFEKMVKTLECNFFCKFQRGKAYKSYWSFRLFNSWYRCVCNLLKD